MAPFLNLTIAAMNKKQHQICLLALFLIFSLWATLVGFGDFSGVEQGFSLTWFVVLYLVAAYLRKYYVPEGKAGRWMGLFLGTGLCLGATKPIISAITQLVLGQAVVSGAFFIYNSPLALAESIFLFLFFADLKIKNAAASRAICFLAPLSLGVQILHGMWIDMLHIYTYANSPFMVGYLFLFASALYVVCAAIDGVRQWLFKPLRRMTWPDRLMSRIERALDR